MSEKVVFITGGSSGIGLATTKLFLARGWKVANLSLSHSGIEHENHISITGDICDETARTSAIEQTISRFGKIDVLVNNAAVGLYSTASNSDIADVRKLFDINFFSLVELTRQVVVHMKQNPGRCHIVNLGSVGGYASLPWAAFYCASKFAVHAFNDSLRREMQHSKSNIHVAKICPGIVETAFRENVIGGQAPGNVKKIRKIVTPEQVAKRIAYAIDHNRAEVSVPFLSRIFIKLEQLLPSLMDWYVSKKW